MTEPVIFGTHEKSTLAQLADVASRTKRTALMADGHLGYIMPIGGVAAYENQVSVVGVGFDIACGNAAILTNRTLHDYSRDELTLLADEIQATISFGVGRTNKADDAPTDHALFQSPTWDAVPFKHRQGLYAKATNQLGTVGSGNHYVDVFADEQARIWVGVHFGSRGFGHTVASAFLALAQNQPWDARVKEQETIFDLDQPLGQDYWALMSLAGEYAYAGREWVARKVVSLIGGQEVDLVHNHHNFAWKEMHDGTEYVVVRKGATPAFPGQRGFVGGSMGDNAVIIEGAHQDSDLQRSALYSTVHGAGRVMGRMDAKKGRAIRDDSGKPTGPRDTSTIVTRQMMSEWTKDRGVIVRGGDVDESPHVYRRLPDVLKAQGDTINVLHELTPVIVVMAGGREYDPYKD